MIRVTSLFSGIGAFEKALTNLGIGYELVNFCEFDEYASKSYCAIHNVDPSKNLGDITKIDIDNMADFDLLTYGFPCQDISVAGNQKGIIEGETRSGLLFEAMKIIKAKRPKYAIAENVKNLVGKKFKPDFDVWLQELESLGYTNYWKVLNAKDYGIPQNRERVFVVSILNDTQGFEFPQGFDNGLRLKDILENEVDERYYLSNERIGMILKWNAYQRPLTRILGTNSLSPTLTARGAGEYHSGMILYSKDYENVTNYETVPTNSKIRYFTEKECFKLMGFTDNDFQKCVDVGISNSQLYKQAGNSIVVSVLEYIFKNLFV